MQEGSQTLILVKFLNHKFKAMTDIYIASSKLHFASTWSKNKIDLHAFEYSILGAFSHDGATRVVVLEIT